MQALFILVIWPASPRILASEVSAVETTSYSGPYLRSWVRGCGGLVERESDPTYFKVKFFLNSIVPRIQSHFIQLEQAYNTPTKEYFHAIIPQIPNSQLYTW